MTEIEPILLEMPPQMAGRRLDQGLAELLPDYSRARLQKWIKAGKVTVDGKVLRPKDTLSGGEQVIVKVELAPKIEWKAEDIPLDVVYEDEEILIINKPIGLVVHPGAGNYDGTMVNALLNYAPELAHIPRAGIIHRLDKDTTGLLVVARTVTAHQHLVALLQEREMKREYIAVVCGVMTAGGTVDAAIGRHPVHRTRMAVNDKGKPAVTHYRVTKRFRSHSQIRLQLESGRTHQIRVHMAHIHYPIVGDPVYGGRLRIPPDCDPALSDMLRHFKRQALHAATLGFEHPASGELVEWSAPIPDDMQALIDILDEDMQSHAG